MTRAKNKKKYVSKPNLLARFPENYGSKRPHISFHALRARILEKQEMHLNLESQTSQKSKKIKTFEFGVRNKSEIQEFLNRCQKSKKRNMCVKIKNQPLQVGSGWLVGSRRVVWLVGATRYNPLPTTYHTPHNPHRPPPANPYQPTTHTLPTHYPHTAHPLPTHYPPTTHVQDGWLVDCG